MYPMRLVPCYKDYLWGGNKLSALFGKSGPMPVLAESWELACHPDGHCVIQNGPFCGLTLDAMLRQAGVKLLGDKYFGNGEFPILVKFIDAAQDLSVQVHPSDATALTGEKGKAEMWYVVDCEPRSYIYHGFNRQMTQSEIIARAKDGSICEVLNQVPVHRGDIFYILPGTVHAICKGIIIAEIQQNSNTTFRLYDYKRRGADGKLRELHLERAAQVACCEPSIPAEARSNNASFWGGVAFSEMFSCSYFRAYKADVTEDATFCCGNHSFQHLLFVEGSGHLVWQDKQYSFARGDSYFLPANLGAYTIEGHCRILISTL